MRISIGFNSSASKFARERRGASRDCRGRYRHRWARAQSWGAGGAPLHGGARRHPRLRKRLLEDLRRLCTFPVRMACGAVSRRSSARSAGISAVARSPTPSRGGSSTTKTAGQMQRVGWRLNATMDANFENLRVDRRLFERLTSRSERGRLGAAPVAAGHLAARARPTTPLACSLAPAGDEKPLANSH